MSGAGSDELSRVVNYESEFEALLGGGLHGAGANRSAHCPFSGHKAGDRNESLSVNIETGQWKCHGCGRSGNLISMYAELSGVDNREAYKQLCEKYHVQSGKDKTAASAVKKYTVADYAREKMLPETMLRDDCRMEDGKQPYRERAWIKIPYMDETGTVIRWRRRFAPGEKDRFCWGPGSVTLMYGEWRLPEFRDPSAGTDQSIADGETYAVLVEGESDTQTLWHLGINALGVPGSGNYKREWTQRLGGLDRVYLHIESDNGGEQFFRKMCEHLYGGGYPGRVYRVAVSSLDPVCKDPSALYIARGGDASRDATRAELVALLAEAESVDIKAVAESVPTSIDDEPIHLRIPDGWRLDEQGIWCEKDGYRGPEPACASPILITRRLRSAERVNSERIEVSFRRDGRWHSSIQSRSTVFAARTLPALADMGLPVTSENARYIVQYLAALEAENMERIPKMDSISSFGWIEPGRRFFPGSAGDVVPDIDPSMQQWAGAYCVKGTLEEWEAVMYPHRERPLFRFLLAASFAAPLIKLTGAARSFLVYNWGDSKSGKTAALKAAISAWGDPNRLAVTFNATQVGLERMAGFFCDLPLGIDERQLAGGNLEKLVYMLGNGQSKVRGAKTGGVQAMNSWQTVALCTGEEPIATETSQTGVSSRVIELYGSPFPDEASAAGVHQALNSVYGAAGPEYVRRLITPGLPGSTAECPGGMSAVTELYQTQLSYVSERMEYKNGAHAADIALVTTADILISQWFFAAGYEAAVAGAHNMADSVIAMNAENSARDVNESARQFVADWINTNWARFTTGKYGERYGFVEADAEKGCYVFAIPSLMDTALRNAGYSPDKTKKYLAKLGILETSQDGKKTRYTTRHTAESGVRIAGYGTSDAPEPEVVRAYKISKSALDGVDIETQTVVGEVVQIQEDLPAGDGASAEAEIPEKVRNGADHFGDQELQKSGFEEVTDDDGLPF